MQLNILSLLPCFPWEGPPLPRFLGLFWASLFRQGQFLPAPNQGGTQPLALPQPTEFIKSVGEVIPKPSSTYSNVKEWEITYNQDGLPVKIVKHVKAVINGNE
jgi:hypothetical protein